MSFVTQPFCANEGAKVEVSVTASAGTSQLLGQPSGPFQLRVCNYDTVRVAFRTGAKATCDAVSIANSKTIQPGATEVFTVMPNSDGAALYWNICGDTSPTGNKFEVVIGAGY